MSELIGLPRPPAVGASRVAGRHLRRRVRCSSPVPAPVSARRSPPSSPGSAPAIVIASRKPEHLDAGRAAIEAVGARRAHGRVRHPRRRPDRGRVRRRPTAEMRAARCARQQRGRQLPGAGRGHVAQCVAHGRRHHAQRHVPLRPGVRPAAHRRGHARLDHQHRRVVRVDGRSRASSTRRRRRRA